MSHLRVFVSSVQNELQDHRVAVSNLITIDPFLQQHCNPLLYEFEPASTAKAASECIKLVKDSQVFVLIVGNEYGHVSKGGLSITHQEYRQAKKSGLPVLVFIRGLRDTGRDEKVKGLIKEIREDEYKYKRFTLIDELQNEARKALYKVLKEVHQIEPTSDEKQLGEDSIEAASEFGMKRLPHVTWTALDIALVRKFVGGADGLSADRMPKEKLRERLRSRGMVWFDPKSGEDFATCAAVVLLGKDPAAATPQARIMLDAYNGTERSPTPDDSDLINDPLPTAVDRAVDFVQRNTRHPIRIAGLNRVKLDEYPLEALREAIVNAVAHRDYEQEGQRVSVEVFSDRVVISSPGLPPRPVTIAKLRSGRYRPCSRNPLLAYGLSFFQRIEERGTGIGRMKAAMADHGLDPPRFSTESGHFQVVFPGPGDDMDRIRVPKDQESGGIPPSVESQLNDRQRQIVETLLRGEKVTSRWCEAELGITRDTAVRDLKELVTLEIAEKKGAGRSTHYVLAGGN